jgi:formylmethanofuran dehydrogenase subunit C
MITITPKTQYTVPVQAACINPDLFAGKSVKEIAALPITEGNKHLLLGDLFEITYDNAETPSITLNGDFSKVKRVGQGMSSGEIIFNGNARHAHWRKNVRRQNHCKRQRRRMERLRNERRFN